MQWRRLRHRPLGRLGVGEVRPQVSQRRREWRLLQRTAEVGRTQVALQGYRLLPLNLLLPQVLLLRLVVVGPTILENSLVLLLLVVVLVG